MENPLLQSWLHKNPKSINNPSNKSKHIKVVKENTQPKLNTFMKKCQRLKHYLLLNILKKQIHKK